MFALLTSTPVDAVEQAVIRVGHFQNLTHAQAVIAHGLSRAGKGWFEARLGTNVTIQWFVYNAGPTADGAATGDLLQAGRGNHRLP